MVCFKSSAEVFYVGGIWLFPGNEEIACTVVEFRDDILYCSFDSNNCNVV